MFFFPRLPSSPVEKIHAVPARRSGRAVRVYTTNVICATRFYRERRHFAQDPRTSTRAYRRKVCKYCVSSTYRITFSTGSAVSRLYARVYIIFVWSPFRINETLLRYLNTEKTNFEKPTVFGSAKHTCDFRRTIRRVADSRGEKNKTTVTRATVSTRLFYQSHDNSDFSTAMAVVCILHLRVAEFLRQSLSIEYVLVIWTSP